MEPITTAAIIAGGTSLINGAVNMYNQYKTAMSNKDMQQKQLDYQKYLNANQYRIQAADMQAAGINPAMGNMNSLTSGSYQSQQAPQMDIAPFIDAVNSWGTNRTNKQISDDTISAEEARYTAQLASTEKMEKARLDEDIRHNKAQELIAAANSKNSEEAVKVTKESHRIQNARELYSEANREYHRLADIKDNKIHGLDKELREIYRSKNYRGHGGVIASIGDFILDGIEDIGNRISNNEDKFVSEAKALILQRLNYRIDEVQAERDEYKSILRKYQ